jgi:two-component system, response regulator
LAASATRRLSPCHTASILLIEDNSSDETLACRILRQSGYTNITVIRDGAEALDYLLGLNQFATRRTTDLPVLTLLELDLPTIGGIDVLKAIRADPNTKFLPVVILTGSPDEKDRHAARDAGANGYILKPYDLDELSHDLTALVDYWMIEVPRSFRIPDPIGSSRKGDRNRVEKAVQLHPGVQGRDGEALSGAAGEEVRGRGSS